MKSKIIIGIVVGILIITGMGYAVSSFENNSNNNAQSDIEEISIENIQDGEEKKITLELTDSVTAIGP